MVLEFVRSFDYQFYQNLLEVLIPDVLKPIPSALTQVGGVVVRDADW